MRRLDMSKEFERRGFLLFKGLLPKRVIGRAYRCAGLIASDLGIVEPRQIGSSSKFVVAAEGLSKIKADPTNVAFARQFRESDEYLAVKRAPALLHKLNLFFGHSPRNFEMYNSSWARISVPGGFVTGRHQDGEYVKTKKEFVTVWIPLMDCPRNHGSLKVVPGSHHGGLAKYGRDGRMQGDPDLLSWWTHAYRAGDVLVLHPHLIHGALPNTTARTPRFSIDLRFF